MADPDHLISPDSLNGDDLATQGVFTTPVSTEGRDHLMHPDSVRDSDFVAADDFTYSLTLLDSDGSGQEQLFSEIVLTPRHSLQVDSIGQSNELSVVNYTQHGQLIVDGLTQSVSLTETPLSQHNLLALDSLQQSVEVEGDLGLQQNSLISIDGFGQTEMFEQTYLEQLGSLTVYEAFQQQSEGEVQLTQGHLLYSENISQPQQLFASNLDPRYALTINFIEQITNVSASQIIPVLVLNGLEQSQQTELSTIDTSGYVFPHAINQSQIFGQSFFTGLYISHLIGEIVMYNTLEAKPYMGPLYIGET